MRIGNDSTRRILLYEYTSSGGLLDAGRAPNAASLVKEGWAILQALASDFAAIPGVQIHLLIDHRRLPAELPRCRIFPVYDIQEHLEQFYRLSAAADWSILVAPEFDGILGNRCRVVEQGGGRLLGPASSLVEILSDKQRTSDHLTTRNIRTTCGFSWRPGMAFPADLPCPAVIKPSDGAGSQDTYVCPDQETAHRVLRSYARPARVERFSEGIPASVAFLCGQSGRFALLPCIQRLHIGDQIGYLGGSLPLPAALEQRATCLAERAVESLPNPLGYVGVDLILGGKASGADDRVVEINPRLTTSYLGLRAASRASLAKAMLDVAEGRCPTLSFDPQPLEFDADGTVRRCQSMA